MKIDFALANGISFYYTGYISTSISKFDYKLFPDKEAVEVYLPLENKWVRYNAIGKTMLEAYFLNYIIQYEIDLKNISGAP
jgi:arginine-tRNA-protein transferase